MKVTNSFTDDRLPCVEFEHGGRSFELWWTSRSMEGLLTAIEEINTNQLLPILKRYKKLVTIISDPQAFIDSCKFDADGISAEEREDEAELTVKGEDKGDVSVHLDCGMLVIKKQ